MTRNTSVIEVILLSLLCAPIIFICGIIVGVESDLHTLFTAETLPSWVAAIATVAIAVLTFILARETWYLREAQNRQIKLIQRESIRPVIGLELQQSKVSFQFMDIVITNHGKGFAKDIRFNFISRENNTILEKEDPIVDLFYGLSIFKNGMAILGIKQSLRSHLINFIDLHNKYENDTLDNYFEVNLSYKDTEGYKYSDIIIFDFSVYKGITEVGDSNPLNTISDEIKKINTTFNAITATLPTKKLHVNAYNTADRNISKFKMDNMREERIDKQKKKKQL
jgi:hypothetical protein